MSRILLASTSETRAGLLRGAGVVFEVAGSGVDEAPLKVAMAARGADPAEIALGLAEAKATATAKRHPDALVIGADQTLEFDGRLFDKAESLAEARERLALMRGRSHRLHAAVVTYRAGRQLWAETVTSHLTMRAFSDAFLDAYLARNQDIALWSVGAYALEGEGVQLFERIDGDYFAILGLPLIGLLAHLRDQGSLER